MENRTVLVIDDAEEVRKILRFHLETKYKVMEAADGEKGLAMIFDKHPDLVILDINMPKMNGIELYGKLSPKKGKPFIPIIVLTVREELGALFKDLDVDGFITKPFDIEDVLEEIEGVMGKRYNLPERERAKTSTGAKKILVVDNDEASLDKIAVAFLNDGYIVQSAPNALVAFEKIITDIPDLITIKLGLPDISGDLVCLKLKQMPRTMDIPLLLYMPPDPSFDRTAVKSICRVIDSDLIETNDPGTLLSKVKAVFAVRTKGRPQKEGEIFGGI
jgi:DNA-binding response OmpR family regulator